MARYRINGFLLYSVFFLHACASAPSHAGVSEKLPQPSKEIESEILAADAEIESAVPAPAGKAKVKRSSIPIEVNENVRKWIHYFAVKDRARFQRFLDRGNRYKSLVKQILRENDVPSDLYYLAMIESGFVTHARSHAQAVGVWQFIEGTGLRYGLRQDDLVDERKDVVRATKAAAKYLKNLHTAFQSWYLAMAGYNAGEGRILGAIMRGGSRDFWDLVEKRALPPETRNYVPKFLAALIIGKNPRKYGFSDSKVPEFPEIETAHVPGGIKLADLARKAQIPFTTLKAINPHLLHASAPAGTKNYPIWVPAGSSGKVARVAMHLPKTSVPNRRIASTVHRVKRGENLALIARRHGISVAHLKHINGLKSNKILVGHALQVTAAKGLAPDRVYHRVRHGDSLIPIARRYRVSTKSIKKLNELRGNRIFVGQRLLVRAGT